MRKDWNDDELRMDQGALGNAGACDGVDGGATGEIANVENEATRSLMHRYNIGAGIMGSMHGKGEKGMVAMATWFRFMALRQLQWNNNYNVKPREISAAQLKVTEALAGMHQNDAHLRDVVRLTMATIGRGGTGDVGQRIRDEILDIQSANHCKGGMMEEWHQKLHNNTTPDDIVICEAYLAFLRGGGNKDRKSVV